MRQLTKLELGWRLAVAITALICSGCAENGWRTRGGRVLLTPEPSRPDHLLVSVFQTNGGPGGVPLGDHDYHEIRFIDLDTGRQLARSATLARLSYYSLAVMPTASEFLTVASVYHQDALMCWQGKDPFPKSPPTNTRMLPLPNNSDAYVFGIMSFRDGVLIGSEMSLGNFFAYRIISEGDVETISWPCPAGHVVYLNGDILSDAPGTLTCFSLQGAQKWTSTKSGNEWLLRKLPLDGPSRHIVTLRGGRVDSPNYDVNEIVCRSSATGEVEWTRPFTPTRVIESCTGLGRYVFLQHREKHSAAINWTVISATGAVLAEGVEQDHNAGFAFENDDDTYIVGGREGGHVIRGEVVTSLPKLPGVPIAAARGKVLFDDGRDIICRDLKSLMP